MAVNMKAIAALARRHRAQVLMPVKSFPHPTILGIARNLLQGFEVSTEAELELAAPRSNQLIVASGPTPWNAAREATITFLDKPGAINHWRRLRNARSFGIRLDPAALVSGLPHSRFGMRPTEAVALLEGLTSAEREAFGGFQIHLGEEASERQYFDTVQQLISLAAGLRMPLHCIDLGGGFRTWSFDKLERMLSCVRSRIPDYSALIFEPGYLLTRNAGFAAGRVLSMEGSMAVTTLSKAAHIRWSSPRLVARARQGKSDVLFLGPTCFEGDHVGIYREAARFLRPSEIVLFANISGYCVAWNTSFNGWPSAHVVIVDAK